MKKILMLAISILCFSMTGSSYSEDDRGYIVKVGDKAPDIAILMPDSTKVMLSELRGKVVMLQFTATWCGVCIKEMPHIEKDIWVKHRDNKDFVLYGLMYKQNGNDVKNMVKRTNVTYPLAIDTEGVAFHKFAEQGAGVTRNVIIDREGKIVFLTRLYNTEEFDAMVEKIDQLLDGSSID